MTKKPFEEEIAEFFAPYYKATFYPEKYVEKVKGDLRDKEKKGLIKDLSYDEIIYEMEDGNYKKVVIATAIDLREEKETIFAIGEYVSETPDIEKWSHKHQLMAIEDKKTLIDKIKATGFNGNLRFFE